MSRTIPAKVWAAAATLAAAIGWRYAPYLLFYVLPFAVTSFGLGMGWLVSCRGAPEKRRYTRLAALIPASLGAMLMMLVVLAPGSRMPRPTPELPVKALVRSKRQVVPENVTSSDPWADRFRDFYVTWYNLKPTHRILKEPRPTLSFGYEHVRWTLMLAAFLGGPFVFLIFYPKDWDSYQSKAKQVA